MFVGHGLLAFAIAALAARRVGCSRERALATGVVAGAFATLPDIDMLYAPVGLLGSDSALDATTGFWAASSIVHRGLTHSVIVAVIAATAFALWAAASTHDDSTTRSDFRTPHTATIARAGALLALGALVTIGLLTGGGIGGVVMGAFVVVGLALTRAAIRVGGFAPKSVFAVAAFGLASHPVGDLFTGTPPAFLAPLDATLLANRVALSPDPTLQLLGAFGIELGVIWLAAAVYCRLTDRRLLAHVHGRAALGIAYASAVLLLTPPTLDSSYSFVFSVLAVGVVGPAPLAWRARTVLQRVPLPIGGAAFEHRTRTHETGAVGSSQRRISYRRAFDGDTALAAILTGLSAITLAALSYTVAYLLG